MKTAVSLNAFQKRAVDKTAYSLHEAFDVDKERAVDTYDIAKKMGLFSKSNVHANSYVLSPDDVKKIRLNNSSSSNEGRFILADKIANYIVSSASPNSNLSSDVVQTIVDTLTMSLLIPRDEAMSIYNRLMSEGISEEEIYKTIGKKYGVSTEIAKKRLGQAIEDRYYKDVQEEKQRNAFRKYK